MSQCRLSPFAAPDACQSVRICFLLALLYSKKNIYKKRGTEKSEIWANFQNQEGAGTDSLYE